MLIEGTVVVGTDGSQHAEQAVRWAAGRASLYGVGLSVVRVLPQVPVPSRGQVFALMRQGSDFLTHVQQVAASQLEQAQTAALQACPSVPVSTEIITGDAAQVLAQLSHTAKLVVVGATGASGVSGALLGGTAVHIIAHAQGPVVVVPATLGDPQGPVVVGLDDTEAARGLAQVALEQAAATGCSLLAVHAWDTDASIGFGEPIATDIEQVNQAYDELLVELTQPSADRLHVPVQRHVVRGRAEKVLLQLAPSASMVVVGSRGRGGFAGLLLGSVSRSVVGHAQCPVMVVRQ